MNDRKIHIFALVVFVVLLAIGSPSPAASAVTANLLQQSDFTYVGAFKLPGATFG
jgi:hypothetical protein